MIKLSACVVCGALSLYVAISAGTTAFADDSVAPVRLDPDKIAGLGLTAVPPDAFKDILVGGELNMPSKTRAVESDDFTRACRIPQRGRNVIRPGHRFNSRACSGAP